ncbi:hypothetical protein ACLOJK_005758 [Asimina triloba]
MGIKEFLISFIFASILFIIPTILTTPISTFRAPSFRPLPPPPVPISFAYLISASRGDIPRLKRTLKALYHPSNCYLLHLDLEADPAERLQLSEFVAGEPTFAQFGNVWIVGGANLVTYRGPTMLANTLHAMSMLLRTPCNWDWFINLSASDYPLICVTMCGVGNFFAIECLPSSWELVAHFADLIHVFSNLSRDLNFVQHSARLGWKL